MKKLATENTEGTESRGRKNALDCHDAAYGHFYGIRLSSFPVILAQAGSRRESSQINALDSGSSPE